MAQRAEKLKKHFISFVQTGASGSPNDPLNRIIIFCNFSALIAIVGSMTVAWQLSTWGIEPSYMITQFFTAFLGGLLILFNVLGHHLIARIFTALVINLAAWNAMFFFGKSFNGYLLFFAAIAFSILAFGSQEKQIRRFFIFVSILGMPLSDWLYAEAILPVTSFHSSQAPFSLLITDTMIVTIVLVSLLFIEKSNSEKYEGELKALNAQLEDKVKQRTEMLKKANHRAIKANKAKSQFIANTSHELRTPLTAILGFVDLLQKGGYSKEQHKEYLGIIERSSKQLIDIVNDVLDLSKMEANKLEINRELVNSREFFQDIEMLMALRAKEKNLDFEIKLSKEVPSHIFVDPLRLKQILVNLVGNAIKFTEFGEVSVQISFSSTHQKLLAKIRDTGPGINPQVREKLFRPFSQGDDSLRRLHGGTGLGLALSFNLAKKMGGSLELKESSIGKGSVFELEIDIEHSYITSQTPLQKNENPVKAKPIIEGMLKGKDILVVDDSPDNRLLISQYMKASGGHVDMKANGHEALETLKKDPGRYDAVIMDLQMPIMDGYEATKILRSWGYSQPIVAFSAHAMTEEKEKALRSGFSSYLSKPVTQSELISRINDVIDQRP